MFKCFFSCYKDVEALNLQKERCWNAEELQCRSLFCLRKIYFIQFLLRIQTKWWGKVKTSGNLGSKAATERDTHTLSVQMTYVLIRSRYVFASELFNVFLENCSETLKIHCFWRRFRLHIQRCDINRKHHHFLEELMKKMPLVFDKSTFH